jgi:Chromo (CHRromatin Organisation MOdifier) domain
MKWRRLQYLVRWKGYGNKENLWISEKDLDAPKLMAKHCASGHCTLKGGVM